MKKTIAMAVLLNVVSVGLSSGVETPGINSELNSVGLDTLNRMEAKELPLPMKPERVMSVNVQKLATFAYLYTEQEAQRVQANIVENLRKAGAKIIGTKIYKYSVIYKIEIIFDSSLSLKSVYSKDFDNKPAAGESAKKRAAKLASEGKQVVSSIVYDDVFGYYVGYEIYYLEAAE